MSNIEKAREALAGKCYVVDAIGSVTPVNGVDKGIEIAGLWGKNFPSTGPYVVCQLTPVTDKPAALDEDRMVWEAAVAFASAGNFTPESAIVRARALLEAFKEAAK